MGVPLSRYTPSRRYLTAGFVALLLAGFSAWCGLEWAPAFVPAVLFVLTAGCILFLALQPRIEIHEDHLVIGKRVIPWVEVRRLDRADWVTPLVVRLTLEDKRPVMLIYLGDLDSINSLLRHLRRSARQALIDGIPYREFWGETIANAPDRRQLPSPKYHLLRPEDEAEVERLYQRLKSVGHLDPSKSADEK